MKHKNYYNICEFAQKVYTSDPALFPTNNIPKNWRSRIKAYNVIDDEFNSLFYYAYIIYLIKNSL